VIYGERGVGKTSLAAVGALLVQRPDLLPVRVNCDGTDHYGSVWRKVFSRIKTMYTVPGLGCEADDKEMVISAAESLPADPKPHDVETVLTLLTQEGSIAVFIDEFDRVQDPSDVAYQEFVFKGVAHRIPVTAERARRWLEGEEATGTGRGEPFVDKDGRLIEHHGLPRTRTPSRSSPRSSVCRSIPRMGRRSTPTKRAKTSTSRRPASVVIPVGRLAATTRFPWSLRQSAVSRILGTGLGQSERRHRTESAHGSDDDGGRR
jgi:hypothetical protein